MTATADAGSRRLLRWELAGTILCGVVLLAWGAQDLRRYLPHRLEGKPNVPLLETGVEHYGSNELFHIASTLVELENIGEVEHGGGHRFRHALGPVTSIKFWSALKTVRFTFRYDNLIADQHLTLTYNGRVLEEFEHMAPGLIERTYKLDIGEGDNVFTFSYGRYNHHESDLAPADSRRIAGDFLALEVQF